MNKNYNTEPNKANEAYYVNRYSLFAPRVNAKAEQALLPQPGK